MRDEKEIQKAHDILHFVATTAAPFSYREEQGVVVHNAHDVLAWALGFPCGEAFAHNLANLEAGLKLAGFVEVDAGKPLSAEEAKEKGLE